MGGFASMDSNYYYISASHLKYEKTYYAFQKNPSISISELKKIFEQELEMVNQINNDKSTFIGVHLQISLYSNDDTIDESLFKKLEESFIKQSYLPDFNYAFTLNENALDTKTNRVISKHYPDTPTETGFIKVKREVSGND